MLVVFVLFGLAMGLAFGGRIQNLKSFCIKAPLLPIAAFAIKYAGGFLRDISWAEIAVCVVHYLLLLLFFWFNRSELQWAAPAAAGTLLNFAVVAANGGRMPVSSELLEAWGRQDTINRLLAGEVFSYCLANSSTKLNFLGDIVPVAALGRLFGFASVGDILLGVGCAILAFRLIKPPKQSN